MESVIKLINTVKNMTAQQMINTMIVLGFIIWFSTEGRETWLGDSEQAAELAAEALNTELLVQSINQTAIREDKQDSIMTDTASTLQLMQQKFEMEIENLKDDVEDLEESRP